MKASAVNEAARLIHGAADRKPTGLALLLAREGRLVGAYQAEELDRLETLVPELQARVVELEAQRVALAARLRDGQRWQQGRSPRLVSEDFVSQDELRSIFGISLTAPWDVSAEVAELMREGAVRLRAELETPDEAPHVAPCRWPASPDCTCGPIASGGGR